MSQLITQELAIVISVKTQNPSLLNEDFLKQTGIVPSDWKLARELVGKAADLGLIGANIPEEYGGLGLDQTSGALVGENIGRCASFATTLGAEFG